MERIQGGVCAPQGFLAAGVHCGILKNKQKKDLALIYSLSEANAAAVYTRNLVKGAPIEVTRENIADGRARAVICNSGNANTCNADGPQVAREMCALAAEALNISAGDVIVASTGVIGQRLDITPIAAAMDGLCKALSDNGSNDAAEAIMTTDTRLKEIAVSFTAGGKECRIGGIAKGSGMIHPNMATMLVFLTTDCAVSSGMLKKALSEDVEDSFNMISVDGDTSTNDMVCILANGTAGNKEITAEDSDYRAFAAALAEVTRFLCRAMAKDGEGATKLIECAVTGAPDNAAAKTAAKSVVCSSLVKAAMFGSDANWGRVLCALGYSGAVTDLSAAAVEFVSAAGSVLVCRNGAGVDFSEEAAKKILSEDEITIAVSLGNGPGAATAWGCDLSYEYVRINGDYRT